MSRLKPNTGSKGILTWLIPCLRGFKRQIILALLLGLVTYGCAAMLMFASGYLISRTYDPRTTLFMVMVPVAFVQIFGLGRPIARYFERLVSHDWVFRVTSKLRLILFQAAELADKDPSRASVTGEYLNALNSDIGHLQNVFLRVVFPALISLLLFLAACIVCGLFSPQLLLIMALCGLSCVFVLPYIAVVVNRMRISAMQELRSNETVALTDDLLGISDWIISGQSSKAYEVNSHALREVSIARKSIRSNTRLIEVVSLLLMGAALSGNIICCGNAYGGVPEWNNYIAAFALGFFPLIEVFMLLPASLSEAVVHNRALVGLDGLISINSDETRMPSGNVEPAHMELEASPLKVSGLSYRYPAGCKEVLAGLDLAVLPLQKTAILGRSGSGKSTLASIIRGDLPGYNGEVSLYGHMPSEYGDSCADIVGYLSQDPRIFSRTLRSNLLLDRTGISDEALIDALGKVGLLRKFESLPNGLDTVIGEMGIGFSGGEAHRLALARVLLSPAPLILLDEPFSAVDPKIERELLDTMFEALADRTLLVITHHLAQIDKFDRVVFLEEGRIALEGFPEELFETSDYFRNLIESDRSM